LCLVCFSENERGGGISISISPSHYLTDILFTAEQEKRAKAEEKSETKSDKPTEGGATSSKNGDAMASEPTTTQQKQGGEVINKATEDGPVPMETA
jgi:hypothetical protein